MEIPAISVIIAMYNTEKFIGDCLDSILAQTFTNFEVIVVDDCSTDSSAKIAESFISKFGGRMNLLRRKKNSGNNGIPNNMGLAFSRGEYVIFIDADDAITPDALEKLYIAAKNFNADVVGCEKFYAIPEDFRFNTNFNRQFEEISYQAGDFVTEPTLITDDFSERVKDCSQRKFLWNIWSKLIRREFLIENKITITNEMANDMLLTCFLVYSAKRYVRVPYVVNFYRVVESSLTHKKRDPLKQLKKYISALTVGFAHLNNFLNEQEFFQNNHAAKYMAFDTYVQEILFYLNDIYLQIPVAELDDTLRELFSASDNTALMVFNFSAMNIYRLEILQNREQIGYWQKRDKYRGAYIAELEKFVGDSQQRIAELENELRSKG